MDTALNRRSVEKREVNFLRLIHPSLDHREILIQPFSKNRESGRGIVEARLPHAITLSHQHKYYLNVNYLELAFSKQTYYSSVSSIEKEAITLY